MGRLIDEAHIALPQNLRGFQKALPNREISQSGVNATRNEVEV